MKFLKPILLLLLPIAVQAQLPCKWETSTYYQLYNDGRVEKHVRGTPVKFEYGLTEVNIDFGLSKISLTCPCILYDEPLAIQKMQHNEWIIMYDTRDFCGLIGVALGNSIQLFFSKQNYDVEYYTKNF